MSSIRVKICHITTVHSNRYDDRIFERECVPLAKMGFEVTLIVNDSKRDEIVNGIRIISLRKETKNRIERAICVSVCAYKKAIEREAHLYHIHDPELLPMALKLQKHGKKVIFDSHEFTTLQIMDKNYIPWVFRKIVSRIYYRYETKILSELSGLVMPCTYGGRDFFEGVDVPKAIVDNCPSLELLKSIYISSCKEKKVCYIGSISESRGIVHIIRGAAKAGVPLVLAGEVSSEIKKKIESMTEYSNVEYKGLLPHGQALEEASKCMVGLALLQNTGQYPRLDNLPTKLYEYMMLGIPSVISNFDYYVKAVDRFKFGLIVDPEDEDSIAAAIKKLIEDKSLRIKMINEGRRAIKEKYNNEIEIEKLRHLYNLVLSKNG